MLPSHQILLDDDGAPLAQAGAAPPQERHELRVRQVAGNPLDLRSAKGVSTGQLQQQRWGPLACVRLGVRFGDTFVFSSFGKRATEAVECGLEALAEKGVRVGRAQMTS